MFSSEMEPYIKTGGLAVVIGALPFALLEYTQVEQVDVFVPLYKPVKKSPFSLKKVDLSFTLRIGSKNYGCNLWVHQPSESNVRVFFVDNYRLFSSRSALYTRKGKDYKDNLTRFVFFCRSSLESIKRMNPEGNPYDIFHSHDWQTALINLYSRQDEFFTDSPLLNVYTVHNLNYQGLFPAYQFQTLGIDRSYFSPESMEFWGKINLMKAGLVFSDVITTVSPTYAKEILTKDFGAGLEDILQQRSLDIVGILNGVDYSVWNPETDPLIPHNYSVNALQGKLKCKMSLQSFFQLPQSPSIPVFGVVTRITWQKGTDLILEAMERVLKKDIQFILVGTGDPVQEEAFRDLKSQFPKKVGLEIAFSNKLAHLVGAGSDIFLMPSRYEPCGLSDKYSLKYGTVPIVHRTGGLADTIIDYDEDPENGVGFTFEPFRLESFLEAINRALKVFQSQKEWQEMMKRGMKLNFSWKRAASQYIKVYEEYSRLKSRNR
ncbi:MAG: glycogen synthase GlgA [Candidatus Hodarchaeales archaeon]